MNPKLQNCELLATDICSSDKKWMGTMATVPLGQPVEEGCVKIPRRQMDTKEAHPLQVAKLLTDQQARGTR